MAVSEDTTQAWCRNGNTTVSDAFVLDRMERRISLAATTPFRTNQSPKPPNRYVPTVRLPRDTPFQNFRRPRIRQSVYFVALGENSAETSLVYGNIATTHLVPRDSCVGGVAFPAGAGQRVLPLPSIGASDRLSRYESHALAPNMSDLKRPRTKIIGPSVGDIVRKNRPKAPAK